MDLLIKQDKVIAFLSDLFLGLQYPENVVIRSDNGSQFIANSVREYLGINKYSTKYVSYSVNNTSLSIGYLDFVYF